jgi:hypothetical protein
MTLDELAATSPRVAPAPVPAWTWGCFSRRSAVYGSGQEDTASRAVRLQAQGLTGFLTVPGWRPDVSARSGLHDCTVEQLLDLSASDGGVADTAWSDGMMSWDNSSRFQPHNVWPEPGVMARVGPALTQTAPSGACLQEWRLEKNSAGLMVGLRLMFETGLDGLTRPRDGGLIICGDHCLFSLDRRRPLPTDAQLPQQMRQAGDPYAFADMAFDAETAYARRGPDGAFVVKLSTNPFHEGSVAPVTQGFAATSIAGVLRQQIGEGTEQIVRQWRIDTLLPNADVRMVTEMDRAGAVWLKREAGVLLRGL